MKSTSAPPILFWAAPTVSRRGDEGGVMCGLGDLKQILLQFLLQLAVDITLICPSSVQSA